MTRIELEKDGTIRIVSYEEDSDQSSENIVADLSLDYIDIIREIRM